MPSVVRRCRHNAQWTVFSARPRPALQVPPAFRRVQNRRISRAVHHRRVETTRSHASPCPRKRNSRASPCPRKRNSRASPCPRKRNSRASPCPRKRNSCASPCPRKRNSHASPCPRKRNSRASPCPRKRNSRASPCPRKRNSHASPCPRKRNSCASPCPRKRNSRASPCPRKRNSRASPCPRKRDGQLSSRDTGLVDSIPHGKGILQLISVNVGGKTGVRCELCTKHGKCPRNGKGSWTINPCFSLRRDKVIK